MKVIITGHLGYIGTVLTQMLVSEGYEVVGIDSDLYKDCNFGAELREIPTINKDIRDVTVEDLKKFAEMIVQECLLAISKTDVTLEEMPVMVKCHDQVEKHFGIE